MGCVWWCKIFYISISLKNTHKMWRYSWHSRWSCGEQYDQTQKHSTSWWAENVINVFYVRRENYINVYICRILVRFRIYFQLNQAAVSFQVTTMLEVDRYSCSTGSYFQKKKSIVVLPKLFYFICVVKCWSNVLWNVYYA